MGEIVAKVVNVLDPVTGEGNKGPWKKQQFIFETHGEFPRQICVLNWNDRVSPDILKVGEVLKVSVNVASREFNEKWYTDVTMWKVEKQQDSEIPPPLKNESESDLSPGLDDSTSEDNTTSDDDGLPF